MTFDSTRVERTSADTAEVTGKLTLLGETRPVILDVTLGRHPVMNKEYAGFTATTVVRRSEFGMTLYAPAIGDDIRVRIDHEAGRRWDQ